ncbi:MAG: Rieske (2Fe-2S) protein [Candidatus Aramenus sp.]|nr:Rieske (2Fe-2S) protein [Candidatus Aramenus sp.]
MIRVRKPEVKVGEKVKVVEGGQEILLIYLGAGRYLAFDNKCPHLKCDLYKYGVLIREELVCQCHFSHFSVKDGRPRKGPAKEPLKVYSVKDDGEYLIIS